MNQSFNVHGMSCGHCVNAVTNAVNPQPTTRVPRTISRVRFQEAGRGDAGAGREGSMQVGKG